LVDTAVIAQRVPVRTRALSLGVVIAGHVLLAIGLVLAVQIPHLIAPPPIQVSLVPALPLPMQPRAVRPRPAPPPSRPQPRVAPRLGKIVGPENPTPLAIPAAPVDAEARARLLAAPFAPKEGAARGLRTTGGCDDADEMKLTGEERERCRQRTHDLRADAPVYAVGPSDPKKRAYLDAQAAKNEAHRLRMEAPPSPPTVGCATDSRFSNLGFSCVP
jgi:hypothetical protein